MKSHYLKLYTVPKEMNVENEYIIVFELSTMKPAGEYIEVPKLSGLNLHIEGISSDWTNGKLVYPINFDFKILQITLKPPFSIDASSVCLEFNIRINEKIFNSFKKNIDIIGGQARGEKITIEPKELQIELPQEPLPEDFGVMYALENGNNIVLFGQSGKNKTFDNVKMKIKNSHQIAIDSFIASDSPYHELQGMGINLYHELDGKVLDWLLELLQYGDRPSALLINDHTDYEIPWELIYIDTEQCKGFLGALAATSRWGEVKKAGSLIKPEIFSATEKGILISFIITSARFRKNAENEIQEVLKCKSINIESQENFLDILNKSIENVAMLHIASHGTFDQDDLKRSSIAISVDEFLSALNLTTHDMKLIKQSNPIVFINSCHSGKKGKVGWSVNGLNIPFIRKGAKGFIGVMGRVRSKTAADVAAGILKEMKKEQPDPVAEILRKIREKAAKEVAEDSSPELQKKFRDVFMYVFYGSPFKTINLFSNKTG